MKRTEKELKAWARRQAIILVEQNYCGCDECIAELKEENGYTDEEIAALVKAMDDRWDEIVYMGKH